MEKINSQINIKKIIQASFLWTLLSISSPTQAKEIGETKTEIIIDIAWDVTPTEDLRNLGRFEKLLREISKETKMSFEDVLRYPFSNVKHFFDKSYTIVNLETRALPKKITDLNLYYKHKTPKSWDRFFHFATKEEMMGILDKRNSSIEAVSIANNHSKDFGELWFETLKSFAKDENLKYFWANNSDLQIEYDSYKWIKIGMISSTIHNSAKLESEKTKIANAIKKANENNAKIIVIYYHWWAEWSIKPEKYQKELAHFAAEKWATIFAWSHQHVISWTEKYKTKDNRIVPIAYWLWNFMFWWNSNPSDKDSMIFRNTFSYDQKTKTIILKDSNSIPIVATWWNNKKDNDDKFIWYNQFRPSEAKWSDKISIEKKLNDRSEMI